MDNWNHEMKDRQRYAFFILVMDTLSMFAVIGAVVWLGIEIFGG